MSEIGYAGGRLAGAMAMTPARTRYASGLRALERIWNDYRRDAGPGEVGPEYQEPDGRLSRTSDPRRDPLLTWLAANGSAELSAAAVTAARMFGATARFRGGDHALLDRAIELAPPLLTGLGAEAVEAALLAFAARLRADAAFVESHGESYSLPISGGRFHWYAAALPGGCWAVNLALQRHAGLGCPFVVGGPITRELLRPDLGSAAMQASLRRTWLHNLDRADADLVALHRDIARSDDALGKKSRNSRTRDAWLLVVALGEISRPQLRRALGLSRSGTDLVANQLRDAGLVELAYGGRIAFLPDARPEPPPALVDEAVRTAVASLDSAMDDVDRILLKYGAVAADAQWDE